VKGFTNSYITSGQTDPPTIPVRPHFVIAMLFYWIERAVWSAR
jgi:hypothetical protein